MSPLTSKTKHARKPSLRSFSRAKSVVPFPQGSARQSLGAGGWITIVALFGFLLASIALAFWGWNLTDAKISSAGMVSLVLGVVFTTALGAGLMALVFWSSRNGYDR